MIHVHIIVLRNSRISDMVETFECYQRQKKHWNNYSINSSIRPWKLSDISNWKNAVTRVIYMHIVVYVYVEVYVRLTTYDSILFLQIPVRTCGLTRIYYVRICFVVASIVITLWLWCDVYMPYKACDFWIVNSHTHVPTQFFISLCGHIALHLLHGCNYMHETR